MKIKVILSIIGLTLGLTFQAQTTKEEMLADLNKTGGVYYAYPVTESHNTPAPKGYKPFYISHYGRHGSRYLISSNDYYWIADILHKAKEENALTPLGIDVMNRLDSVIVETAERGGDLTPLGVRQHRGIAERMYNAYPEVFKGKTQISARSTLVVRCVLSMDAFCERLKELNPSLQIVRESSQKYMPYLCYTSKEADQWKKEWRKEIDNFRDEMTHPDRLMNSLFNNPQFVKRNVKPDDLMWGFYWLASGMQDIETPISFYDIFTPEELFDLWQVFNFDFYQGHANYEPNNGLMIANATNLLENIITTADEALSSDEPSATLRFGHDGNLIPLAGILDFENAVGKTDDPAKTYEVFADYKIAPMAGNVQIIFFKNSKDKNTPVLIKMMLNEEEMKLPIPTDNFPFYNWEEVRAYYMKKIDSNRGQ